MKISTAVVLIAQMDDNNTATGGGLGWIDGWMDVTEIYVAALVTFAAFPETRTYIRGIINEGALFCFCTLTCPYTW